VSVVYGVAVEFNLTGTMLSVRPAAEGQSVVRVEARGAQGETAADTFTVVVVGPCSAQPPRDATVVFPLSEGQMWAYTLSSYRKMTSDVYEYRSSGRVEVEVVGAGPCTNHTQTFVIRERRTETTDRRRWGQGWEPGEPVTTERTYRWTVTDTHVRTDAPDLSGRPGAGLAPPPFGREAPRFVSISALSPDGTVRLGASSAFGPFVQLADGVGPVRYSTTTVFGTAGSGSVEWTIAE
jgi:hypothetical protein